MKVRIHIPGGWTAGLGQARGLPLGPAIGSLLAPLALIAYLLCAARLGTDLGLLQLSAPEGVWSHWQVWMALAVSSHLVARWLLDRGEGSYRRTNSDWEVRARNQQFEVEVKDRVQGMVQQALDPYSRGGDEGNVNEAGILSEKVPREERKPAFRLAPIAAESEALRRRVRDH